MPVSAAAGRAGKKSAPPGPAGRDARLCGRMLVRRWFQHVLTPPVTDEKCYGDQYINIVAPGSGAGRHASRGGALSAAGCLLTPADGGESDNSELTVSYRE